jgi:hypothetical protein
MRANFRDRLVAAAIKAPSGDNCQPWAFHFIDDNRLEVSTIEERGKSFFDYRLRGTLLSLGAVIENIRVQAASEGHSVSVDYCSRSTSGDHTVTLTLTAANPEPVLLGRVDAMSNRTVNRRPYIPVSIRQADIERLLAAPVESIGVDVISHRADILRWAKVVYLADRVRYSHPGIHQELFEKIRLSKKEAEAERTGLEIDRLGAGPVAKPLMTLIKPWHRMKALSSFGMVHMLAGQSAFTTLASGSLILITVNADQRTDWILAGEQMQRIWIAAHQIGLCTQPVTVGLYLDQRYQREGMANFLSAQEPLLLSLRKRLNGLLGERTGAIIFRVGKGWRMGNTAIRMSPDQFVNTGLS